MRSIKKFSKIVPLLCIFLGLSGISYTGSADISDVTHSPSQGPSPSWPWSSDFDTLSGLTDKFAKDLSRNISRRKLYLDKTSIRDIATNESSRFSSYLQNELESSLSEKGFNMVYEPAEADYLIGATYQRHGDKLRVFFKYHRADGSGRKSLDYGISMSSLPKDSFKESINTKAYKLAASILLGQGDLRLYISPIKEGHYRYVSEFSNSFTSRVKSQIVRLHREVEVIDQKPIHERLSNTRSIKKKAKQVKDLKSSDAFFVNANSVLEGDYFEGHESVTVNLYLKRLDGTMLNSSTVEIKKSLISSDLQNNTAKMLADLADAPKEKEHFSVKISTTKGGDYPVYYKGEKIKFYIQVAAPLYVYIYDINSKGQISLLFPYQRGSGQGKLTPGTLYVIPSENDDFEFEVEPPFGMDAVKLFASSTMLPIPRLTRTVTSRSYRGSTRTIVKKRKEIQKELSSMKSINPRDLVDYYRGIAERLGTCLYEDSLMLETRNR